ncbi:sema domain, immunoglobulin domain (Ig), short basic domain, secreted, (semaphorin) 3H isoform X2 [Erpetoichthys calabaricus]|uniref:sema domain, immunoglobulin domain (Ig), short basic domain, secreted, (semaphorin) 3H isoform X2 n=1 Tax=Erpetoichthys calabaricus TaxID=27687 RepID=UPI0022344E7D|nr:sema domain, immunoglobulin domain (Ig), short basic domain, secreted, (semaphorin) 3H isoform X2 [Erpetoichthys calabaricus]
MLRRGRCGCAMEAALALQLFLLLGMGQRFSSAWKPSQPRLQFTFTDNVHNQRIVPLLFRAGDLHSILMDEDNRKLYAATKDHLVSTNLDNISLGVKKLYWPATSDRIEECKMAGKDPEMDCANFIRVLHPFNQTHLYMCGTGAFHPRCAFINTAVFDRNEQLILRPEQTECGKGKCPYDPRQRTATNMIDGELYAGISSDFMSRDAAFFRSLGNKHVIRTEQYDSMWLQDPKFIKVAAISESNNQEDDKVYVFFTERAQEAENGGSKVIYSRVARVCKNDIGGQRSLVNKWSTFLKARLICSIQGPDGIQTHFDELQDIFILYGKDAKNPLIYGLFTTSSNILNGSAVCLYKMEDIVTAFKGHFLHKEGPEYKWTEYSGRVPFPRPGTCPSRTYGNYRSTREYPDDVIFFSRTHPLMFDAIYPVNHHPLLVRVGVDYKFTRLAVDSVEAVDGQYHVMFIGTDTGVVMKSIYVPGTNQDTQEITLEELEAFPNKSAITAMEISKKKWLYVGSKDGLVQLSLYQCELYGKACAECCLARDPYCTWDGHSCSPFISFPRRRNARQAGVIRNPLTQCFSQGAAMQTKAEEKVIVVAPGNSTYLECLPKSRHATVTWMREGIESPRELQMVIATEELLLIEQGILIRNAKMTHAGTYYCQLEEHSFRWTVLKVKLIVQLPEEVDNWTVQEQVPAAFSHNHQPWYRDFMALVNYPSKMDYYCENVWHREAKKKKNKLRSAGGGSNEWHKPGGMPGKKGRNKQQPRALRSPRSSLLTRW